MQIKPICTCVTIIWCKFDFPRIMFSFTDDSERQETEKEEEIFGSKYKMQAQGEELVDLGSAA